MGTASKPQTVNSAAPTQPPTIDRRLSLTKKQWIGLPLIAAVPLLTLLGFFGEHRAETRAESSRLQMTVRYPERFRYRQIQSLEVVVRNRGTSTIDTIHVSLDTAYIARFSSVRIEPAPRTAYIVDLTSVQPGASRLVSAELWGEEYGRHPGHIVAYTRADSVAASVRTIVFP